MRGDMLYTDPWDSPTLPFGKYVDAPLMYVPSGYLRWLANNDADPYKGFKVGPELTRAAEKEMKLREYIEARYTGQIHCLNDVEKEYIVELLGDYKWSSPDGDSPGGIDKFLFLDMESALEFLEWFAHPDVEDDRILIWEVLKEGHRKVVWHFSGWHWPHEEFGEQGRLVGHEDTLYQELEREG